MQARNVLLAITFQERCQDNCEKLVMKPAQQYADTNIALTLVLAAAEQQRIPQR